MKNWPLLLLLSLIFLSLSIKFSHIHSTQLETPRIITIRPSIAIQGDTVVIRGRHFGIMPQDTVSLEFHPKSIPVNMQTWTNNKIVFTIHPTSITGETLITICNVFQKCDSVTLQLRDASEVL